MNERCICIPSADECHIRKEAYDKAIDEFVEEIENEYDNDACPNVSDYLDYQISLRDLFKIANQLKDGRWMGV